jgi:hypothetical protein
LWAFAAGALFFVLWAAVLITICSGVQTPNPSLFPEIDFASKCVKPDRQEMPQLTLGGLLYPLSNGGSSRIERKMAGKTFFVGPQKKYSEAPSHVKFSLSKFESELIKGTKYS